MLFTAPINVLKQKSGTGLIRSRIISRSCLIHSLYRNIQWALHTMQYEIKLSVRVILVIAIRCNLKRKKDRSKCNMWSSFD